MVRRRRSKKPLINSTISPVLRLWILRLLVLLGGHRNLITSSDFRNDTVADAVGLGEWIDPSPHDFDHKAVLAELRKAHQFCEDEHGDAPMPSCLGRNIQRLAELVNLSEIDCRVLGFAVMLHNEQLIDDVADYLGQMSTLKMFYVISVMLDLTEDEVRASLSMQGILSRSGLLTVDRRGESNLRGKLDLLSPSFADNVMSADSDPVSLLRGIVGPSTGPELALDDFEHISPSLSVLQPYLKQSLSTSRKGVNVFLHGRPGTGKNQLAKALAEELGCELFEVASEASDGDLIDGERRLRSFCAAQSFFSQRRAMILFDEVEDVFDDGDGIFGRKSTAQTRKAWINRMLEENPVPTLWLSNSIECLDPAFIRRFDMVCELPVPPRKQRERIIRNECSDLLDARSITRIAEYPPLAPAVVTKAASVVRSIRSVLGESGSGKAFELLIGNTLEAQGHNNFRKNEADRLPDFYDPAFVHADVDLARIADGIVNLKSGRLCLYGPPGTGKTAYGRWLADKMDVPLQAQKASDLISKWVGEGEKNIATAFKQAAEDGALLLIDEVDSFLQDRRGAQRGWEITMVNEMLTQMESFQGVFVASTNLMDGLDQAALRRFDLKVRFDYLAREQAVELLRRYCGKLGIAAPQHSQVESLALLNKLTPGDFAAVARQSRFHPITSCDALVAALKTECSIKEGPKASIGFLH